MRTIQRYDTVRPMGVRMLGAAVIVLLAAVAAVACSDTAPQPDGGIRIVATTTILGDVVQNVVGDAAEVTVILPPGADPHDYRPSAQDAAAIATADLVIANGLGLEEGLTDVLETAASDGTPVLEIGPLVDPIPLAGGEALDPHVWLDPVRMADAALAIGATLAESHPEGDWDERAAAYAEELMAAHDQIEASLEGIAPSARSLVTNHDSLGYFAARYGFEVVGTVIPGGSTLAEPGADSLRELVGLIRSLQVPAIFVDTTESADLAQALAAEVGEAVTVVELYAGSLGPSGSGAETLIDMLLVNAQRIAGVLAAS